MKIKLTPAELATVEFELNGSCHDDVRIVEGYLVIDTNSSNQEDFYSPLATELYQKYFNGDKVLGLDNYFDNELYLTTYIEDECLLVSELDIDLSYIPPTRSDKKWEDIKQIKDYKYLNIVCLDIETVGINPSDIEGTIKDGRIIMIGLKIKEEEVIISDTDEKLLLENFLSYLTFFENLFDNEEWILTGHNVFNFDLQVIYQSFKKHNIPLKLWVADFSKKFTYSSMYGKPIEYKLSKLYYGNCSIVDTLLLAGAEEKRTNSINSFSLKDLALDVLKKEERRLELDYKEIALLWEIEDVEPIREYLIYDLRDQQTLVDYFLPPVYYLQSVANMSVQQLHYASPAKIWETLLEDYYKKKIDLDLVEPEVGYSYQGALTGVSPGLYRNASKLDVASLYPSIMLRYQLCPLKDKDGIFLKILEYILETRLKIKNSKEKSLKYFQLALKILINGGYGFTGTSGYKFNCYRTAALTTAIGRLLLKKMCLSLQNMNINIIEIDTDGIIVDTSWDNIKDIHNEIQSILPKGISIGIDWEDYCIYVPKSKNYILFKPDGSHKAYGIYKKRNRSIMEKSFPIEYIKRYLESSEKAEEYYRECVIKISMQDIEYIKVRQRIPRGNKWLLELGKIGDIVEFYIAEKVKTHKRTGKPCKSERIAISVDNPTKPLWVTYYIESLKKLKEEIDYTISLTGTKTTINYSSSYYQSFNDNIVEEQIIDYDEEPF